MTENKKRNVTYDRLRIIATVLVVLGHSDYTRLTTRLGGVGYSFIDYAHPVYTSRLLNSIRAMSNIAYEFHMPLFFALSGAVLAIKPVKDGEFIRFITNKFKRLIIPYYLCGYLFMLPVKYFADFYTKENLKKACVVFLYGGESGHLWFLPALFWCMMIFVVICKFLDFVKFNNNISLLVMSAFISLIAKAVDIPDILSFKTGFAYLFRFSCGYVFERLRSKHQLKTAVVILLFAAVTLVEVYIHKFSSPPLIVYTVTGSAAAYLLARIWADVYKSAEHISFISTLFNLFVRNSMFIYLFHDPLEYVVLKYFMNNGLMASAFGCLRYTFSRIAGVIIVSVILGEAISFATARLKTMMSNKVNG